MFHTHLFSVNFDVRDIVLEAAGDVLGELVLAEDDEEASLPTVTVADDCQLLSDRSHCQEPYYYIMRGIHLSRRNTSKKGKSGFCFSV